MRCRPSTCWTMTLLHPGRIDDRCVLAALLFLLHAEQKWR